MKNIKIYILVFSLMFCSCAGIKPIIFKDIDELQMPGIGMRPKISTNLIMYNPNRYGARLSDMNLALQSEGKSLGDIEVVKSVRLKRKSEFIIPVSLTTSIFDLAFVLPEKIKKMQSSQGLEIEFKGDLVIRKFIFKKKFEVSVTERVKL